MRIPVTVPEIATPGEPLRLGEWAVELGATVLEGDCLVEMICPGLAIDLGSPATGIIAEFIKQPEQPIAAGDVIGWLDVSITPATE